MFAGSVAETALSCLEPTFDPMFQFKFQAVDTVKVFRGRSTFKCP